MTSFSLSIQYADRNAETLQFNGSRFIVGREVGDIVLRDPQVSGRHGELRIDPTGKYLTYTDLSSSNGSYRANGERIAGTIPLTQGTSLHIGTCVLTVVSIGSQPSPTPAPRTSKPPPRGSTVVSRAVAPQTPERAAGVVSGSIASESGALPVPENTPPRGVAVPEGAVITTTVPPGVQAAPVEARPVPPRTTTAPNQVAERGAGKGLSSGTWYEVQAGNSNTRTFVMGLSSGNILVRTQTPTTSGLVETMVVAPGSLGDFDLS